MTAGADARRGTDPPTVVIVGGGISGLTAAYRLQQTCPDVDIRLLERGRSVGGKIRTSRFMGRLVDEGPDAFLTRVPWALDLAAELGIADEYVSPGSGSAYVLSRGALRRLPEGLVLGVPTRVRPLLRSGIVGPFGAVRAWFDRILPATDIDGDTPISVGALTRRRLGRQVAERLVDPLIGAINAGDTDRLELGLAAPQLESAARNHRSLSKGLATQRASIDATTAAAPVFHSFPDGMGRLVNALVDHLHGVDLSFGSEVVAVTPTARGADVVVNRTGGGETIHADAVILAAPAWAAADMLSDDVASAAELLSRIEYASVAMVTMGLDRASISHPLDGSGMLVPKPEERLATAASWASTKWPHWAPDGTAVLRVSAGRHGDDRAMHLDDDELVEALFGEMSEMLGIDGPLLQWRVTRWPRSFPQYEPGHSRLVDDIDAALLRDAPGVFVTGAACRGIGIPACIRQGGEAAAKVADRL